MSLLKGNGVVAIRREDKNKWERRAPLTPAHVRQLINEHSLRVLVQPSTLRVFSDREYEEAGATISEDLSSASLVLAVKEVPIPALLPNRTYMFFSHTIKGQRNNMPLLDAVLDKRIRLVDYECITEGGVRGGKRLVAFGRYAGIAGVISFLRGLGERLLALGYSTPLLNIGPCYTYPTLEAAYVAVKTCGEAIARFGLPEALCPLTACFTAGGRVGQGAMEVWQLLPVKWVDPFELKNVVANATGRDKTHVIYAAVASERHMARRKRDAPGAGAVSPRAADASGGDAFHIGPAASPTFGASATTHTAEVTLPDDMEADAEGVFDKADYKARPEQYESVFHVKVVPYCTVLFVTNYWEPRFPRLLTIRQAAALASSGRLRKLLGICDISCDFAGSVEFLKEFTSIEAPFYVYDVLHDTVHHSMEANGVLYHAVDHLPSECSYDASLAFSAALLPFIPQLACSDGSKPFEEQTDLSPEMRGAIITAHGELTPNFGYIARIRAAADRADAGRGLRHARTDSFVTLQLKGHLFDSGIINRILDSIEERKASARIVDFTVGKDRFSETHLSLQLFARAPETLTAVVKAVHDLTAASGAVVSLGSSDEGASAATVEALAAVLPQRGPSLPRRILVLGAGYVSGPVVEYLLRRNNNYVTVASMLYEEAAALAAGRMRVTPVRMDVTADGSSGTGSGAGGSGGGPVSMAGLIADHDLVISLVPAQLHPAVAKHAIAYRKNMVTASYVSPAMAALHESAAAAGITILNEAGLDPGIDHMSAMRMLEGIKARGGTITRFNSLCGGLPAPESAKNPLGYVFSWSPRGVLLAATNAAQFLQQGKRISIPGSSLLAAASPIRLNAALTLDVLPNRDALPYADLYGIAGPQLQDMARGTFRYAGYAAHMHALAALGMLSTEQQPIRAGITMRQWLAAAASCDMTTSGGGEAALLEAVVATVTAAALKDKAALQAAGVARESTINTNLGPGTSAREELEEFLRWCGFLSDAPAPLQAGPSAPAPAPAASGDGLTTYTPLDTLVAVLTSKPDMFYDSGERDMVVMRHEVCATFPDGATETHTATLMEYGKPLPPTGGAGARVANSQSETAMARTVGLTAAIAAQLLLDRSGTSGRGAGVIVPMAKEWFAPILAALEEEKIVMKETVRRH